MSDCSLKNNTKFALSWTFFKPAKFILVPFIYSFGLYKNSLNHNNYEFVNQIGATHIVAHLTNYFSGENPEISSGGNNGWGVCENEPIWNFDLLSGLKKEMKSWVFPLHFIDFETSAVALPFNKGRHPYEQIAFQFSHHICYADGTIEHASEYINTTPGEFPNFKFIEALKMFYHVANIGDARSLAIHPATTTHSQLTDDELAAAGVTPGYVRLCIGLEHIDDIIDDLDQALDKSSKGKLKAVS